MIVSIFHLHLKEGGANLNMSTYSLHRLKNNEDTLYTIEAHSRFSPQQKATIKIQVMHPFVIFLETIRAQTRD